MMHIFIPVSNICVSCTCVMYVCMCVHVLSLNLICSEFYQLFLQALPIPIILILFPHNYLLFYLVLLLYCFKYWHQLQEKQGLDIHLLSVSCKCQ